MDGLKEIDLLRDEKCQSMLQQFRFRLRIKKWIMIIIAILLTIICLGTFSEITIYNRGYYFHYSLGLGWFGFILSYILVMVIWVLRLFATYILQLLELGKLKRYMTNECDPLRTIYIIDHLIKKKLIKEENAFEIMLEASSALNQKERIIYLLRKYPKQGNKSNIRIKYEFLILSKEQQDLQHANYYSQMKTWFQNKKKAIKKPQQMELYKRVEESYDMEYLFYLKDYSACLELIEKSDKVTLLYDVECRLMMAKCYLGLDNKEKAKECLRFVLEHGNTSHSVKDAKALMEKLD